MIQGVVIVEEELEKESEASPWLTAFMVFVMLVVGCLCCWGVVCAAACKQVEDSCTAGSGCDECGCVTTNWGGATFASNHTLMGPPCVRYQSITVPLCQNGARMCALICILVRFIDR